MRYEYQLGRPAPEHQGVASWIRRRHLPTRCRVDRVVCLSNTYILHNSAFKIIIHKIHKNTRDGKIYLDGDYTLDSMWNARNEHAVSMTIGVSRTRLIARMLLAAPKNGDICNVLICNRHRNIKCEHRCYAWRG